MTRRFLWIMHVPGKTYFEIRNFPRGAQSYKEAVTSFTNSFLSDSTRVLKKGMLPNPDTILTLEKLFAVEDDMVNTALHVLMDENDDRYGHEFYEI